MRKWPYILFLMLGILMLSACGDEGKSEADNNKANIDATADSGELEELSLRLGLVVGNWSPHYTGAEAFAEALERETGGKITLQIFPDGQLGGEREMFEAVQSGSLDIGLVSSVVYGSFEPKLTVIDIPYLVSTFEEAETLMDSEVGDKMNEALEAIGIHNLGWGHNDFRIITNNSKAIKEPADLKGIKMRVPESKVLTDWFKSEGALSTVMQFPDIYTALQQGVIDGQDNGPILSYAAKFFEHQKYVTVSNHQYSPVGFLMNSSKWASYSNEAKAVIEKAAAEAVKAERQAIRDFNETAINEMDEAGLEVHYLTDEEKDTFKKSTASFIDQIRASAGDELVDLAIKTAGFEQ